MNLKNIFPLLILSASAQAATIYSIDINDADNIVTEAGWTGLSATNTGNGGSVDIGGIIFGIASSDGARLRGSVGSPSPNALTGDFAFDDGSGQAIILTFGGAGDLAAGEWQVEVWSHDANFVIGDQIVGYRTGGAETIISSTIAESATGPSATFTFTSNGTSAYDVFLRENNANNNTRLNAVRLTLVPEPSSTALLGLGALALLMRKKR